MFGLQSPKLFGALWFALAVSRGDFIAVISAIIAGFGFIKNGSWRENWPAKKVIPRMAVTVIIICYTLSHAAPALRSVCALALRITISPSTGSVSSLIKRPLPSLCSHAPPMRCQKLLLSFPGLVMNTPWVGSFVTELDMIISFVRGGLIAADVQKQT